MDSDSWRKEGWSRRGTLTSNARDLIDTDEVHDDECCPDVLQRAHVSAELGAVPVQDGGDKGGDNGRNGTGGNGDGGGGDDDSNDRIIGLDQAIALAASAGVQLPKEMLAIAKSEGIKQSAVEAYVNLRGKFFTGWIAQFLPWFRNRLIYDDRFLFKVGAEANLTARTGVQVVIDSGCATVAEVRKRGEEFWDEFEFYASDMLVGLVMDVVLVGLMAPTAVMGRQRRKPTSGVQKLLDKVPSAVFEANIPGVRQYSTGARVACVGVKFLEYSLAGMFCGLVGQSLANAAMQARRAQNPGETFTVEPPPLLKTALVWGLFMGVSSNLRYQAVFGLERVVDLTIAKQVPQIAYGTTVAIRFANNVIGGENFIDMARFFGVQ